MNSVKNWALRIDPGVFKLLKRMPLHDAEVILGAINLLEKDPIAGNVKKLKGEADIWRKRTGSYRIFYKIDFTGKNILVFDVARRASNTY